MAPSVRVNLGPLIRFRQEVTKQLAGGSGPIRAVFKQWAAWMRAYWQERFVRASRGGGEWPDLAESTKRRRRGPQQGPAGRRGQRGAAHAATGSFAVLRDTGILFNAVNPVFFGQPGAVEQDILFGVRVGYGGPHRHPGGKATIADIASFHQEGNARLPARPIIVAPNAATLAGMAEDMDRAMQKLAGGQA